MNPDDVQWDRHRYERRSRWCLDSDDDVCRHGCREGAICARWEPDNTPIDDAIDATVWRLGKRVVRKSVGATQKPART